MTPDRVAAAGVSALLLLAAIAVFARRGSRDVGARSTITLFCLVWGVSLGVFAIPWVTYSRPTSVAWAAVYGSLVSFLVASVLAERVAIPSATPADHEHVRPARLRLAIVITALLGYIGFAFFVLAIHRLVGWTTLFTDLHTARKIQESAEFSQEYGTVKVLTYFSGISLLLWTIALRERAFTGKWRLLTPIGLVVAAPYFFLGERLSLLTVAMWIAAFHLLWRPAWSPPRAAMVAALVTVGGLGFFYLIGYQKGATIQNHPELKSQIRTQELQELAFPYLYLTANIPVFSKLTQDPIAPRTYGALTLWPAAKLSNLALRRRDYPPRYGAFYNIPFDGYNSATWLGPFYLDFGFLGCIVLPAVFGFATMWFLLRALRRRTLLAVWIAALGLTIIAFSPLKNAFPDASTWEFLLVAPLVARLVTQRSPKSQRQGASCTARLVRGRWVMTGIGVALAGAVVIVAVVIRVAAAPAPRQASTQLITGQLVRAGLKVGRIYEREGNDSSPHALATRLAVSDPGVTYEGIYAEGMLPATGVIGIIPGEREFRLRARTPGGEVLEVIGVRRNAEYRLVGPRVLGAGLIANGGFEEPLAFPWVIASRKGVEATTTPNALDGAYSLLLQYSRQTRSERTSVSQLVRNLPTRSPGTRYTAHEVVMTRRLSREVGFGLQLIYRDGTSAYIVGTTTSRVPGGSNAIGIPAGSVGPQRMTATGIAEKPVSAVRVFAVDADSRPLSGAIVVDDVQLATARP